MFIDHSGCRPSLLNNFNFNLKKIKRLVQCDLHNNHIYFHVLQTPRQGSLNASLILGIWSVGRQIVELYIEKGDEWLQWNS